MKKKILSLALAVALLAIAIVGGTMAYLTDTDAQVNTFTTGNVAIDLFEDFGDNNTETIEKLLPVTYNSDGTLNATNVIEKEVYVENTGSEKAYVRVHIAIPQILDNGDPSFDASKNVLHFNYSDESIADGKWNWSKTVDGTTGSDWNFYTTQIGQIWYNVYVVTYETALGENDETCDAMHQVYLDKNVTNGDIARINETLNNEWNIYVIAEGTQAQGFNDAYTALNTAFGVPGTYTVNWNAVAEGRTFENVGD